MIQIKLQDYADKSVKTLSSKSTILLILTLSEMGVFAAAKAT